MALLMATSTRLAQGLVGEGAVSVARARRVAPLGAVAPPVQVAAADDPLVKLANEFIYEKSGFYSAADESAFSEEFVFRGPIVGPLTKADYLTTLGTFNNKFTRRCRMAAQTARRSAASYFGPTGLPGQAGGAQAGQPGLARSPLFTHTGDGDTIRPSLRRGL